MNAAEIIAQSKLAEKTAAATGTLVEEKEYQSYKVFS